MCSSFFQVNREIPIQKITQTFFFESDYTALIHAHTQHGCNIIGTSIHRSPEMKKEKLVGGGRLVVTYTIFS
ncbi:hypothetical protein HanRHA438_Chr10g0477531 [Helianthus annuus]|nr:hypothetical protein HanRHA438_Chr10g0477531 [Helianthus annuus]